MSDKILKALMQLFAIVAHAGSVSEEGRSIVASFLRNQISQALVPHYLSVFDEYIKSLQGKAESGKSSKRLAVNSVKVLRICTDINAALDLKQKYIVLVRLVEFVYSGDKEVSEQEQEFLSTVSDTFNIENSEYAGCREFITAQSVSVGAGNENMHAEGDLLFLYCQRPSVIFVRSFGNDLYTINGQPAAKESVSVLSPGAVLRSSRSQSVYYSDLIRKFRKVEFESPVVLEARKVEYIFPNGTQGMHEISFAAESGSLVGIMGGSGAGKSTLLNLLNGNITPSKGEVLLNGIDVHRNANRLEGVIGYVPQDDLLIEELTVFQNLYYSSKLCFENLSDQEITERIETLLKSLGLSQIKDLRVGDVFNKTISGGQRKRLNIALELIRKPQVLFVDEPTSGLSSLDSENVMDLLKQLALNGNLVFVVIHQPSSDVFRLFDSLILLDTGGYHIYYGNPVDSLTYFRQKADFAAAEGACETCGNINPEQLFTIIEAKVLDEYGYLTQRRKISPAEWNTYYKEKSDAASTEKRNPPESAYRKPSRLRQLLVFITRDSLSKLNNTQYLLINFLQAPLLAFIMAYFLRYFPEGEEYIFRENKNLPAYIFMCVIVALFMGLTVSAEEIIHDRKILKREAFLNLSRSSYLLSKVAVVFFISAIQTLSFVLVGNLVFGIKGMFMDYAVILFSVSCFSNMLGLNISSAFDSVVTIYILIPFLIIPQIILSGVIVKYDLLNPDVTSQKHVPVIGEVMAARWAFEALAVNQFSENEYEKHFFKVDKELSNLIYKKDFWLHKVSDRIQAYQSGGDENNLSFAVNELEKESKNLPMAFPSRRDPSSLTSYIKDARKYYIDRFNSASKIKDSIASALAKMQDIDVLMQQYTNESLSDMVLNANELNPAGVYRGEVVRRFRPVYMNGPENTLRSPFFVSEKNFVGKYYSTYWINVTVIWLMTAVLALTLYFNLFRRFFEMSFKLNRKQ